jgi:hypothetical protein
VSGETAEEIALELETELAAAPVGEMSTEVGQTVEQSCSRWCDAKGTIEVTARVTRRRRRRKKKKKKMCTAEMGAGVWDSMVE